MKNTIYKYCLDIEVHQPENGRKKIIINSDFCPKCLTTRELCVFIECLKHINEICINESKERIKNGKKKQGTKKKR